MERVDRAIVARAVTVVFSGVLLASIIVRDGASPHGLLRAGAELVLMLLLMASSFSWGQKHGRAEVIEYLRMSGNQDLSEELWKRRKLERGFDTSEADPPSSATEQGAGNASLSADRTHADEVRGSRQKLTKEQRKRIPEEAQTATHDELAIRYGVSRQHISKLCQEAEAQPVQPRNPWRT
jgi:hypothetical protein